jgi:hypothetical protein
MVFTKISVITTGSLIKKLANLLWRSLAEGVIWGCSSGLLVIG